MADVAATRAGARRNREPDRAARLIRLDPGASPTRGEYPLGGHGLKIGAAADNDLVLSEPTVSRHHAIITRRRGRYIIADLGSTNGTFVNRTRLGAEAALSNRDELRFGAARFVFIGDRGAIGWMLRPSVIAPICVAIALFLASFAVTRMIIRRGTRAGAAPEARLNFRGAPAPSSHPPASAASGANPAAPPGAAARPAASAPRATPAVVNLARMLRGEPEGAREKVGGASSEPAWLERINRYRRMAGVTPVALDPALSAGDRAHARYLVTNYPGAAGAAKEGIDAHTEDPSKPGYSAVGAAAGRFSDVDQMWTDAGRGPNPSWAIEDWMSTPFHRLPILSPRLRRAGYGAYCLDGACAAALNTGAGAVPMPPGGAVFATPIEFPPNGSTMPFRYFGNEWPDPLTACPGYVRPPGLAITLETGSYVTAHLENYSVERAGPGGSFQQVEACGFDAASYSNPNLGIQALGRQVLKDYGAAVIIPRHPLEAGADYRVSATIDGRSYRWSFRISPAAPSPR